MKTVYKTKYSLGLIIPTMVVILGIAILSMMDSAWLGTAIILLSAIYAVYVYSNFLYIIDGNVLHISCGKLCSIKIAISEIRKIEETFGLLTQPAGSVYRIEILYKKFETIQISPKEQERFVKQLQGLNPAIVFTPKKK